MRGGGREKRRRVREGEEGERRGGEGGRVREGMEGESCEKRKREGINERWETRNEMKRFRQWLDTLF